VDFRRHFRPDGPAAAEEWSLGIEFVIRRRNFEQRSPKNSRCLNGRISVAGHRICAAFLNGWRHLRFQCCFTAPNWLVSLARWCAITIGLAIVFWLLPVLANPNIPAFVLDIHTDGLWRHFRPHGRFNIIHAILRKCLAYAERFDPKEFPPPKWVPETSIASASKLETRLLLGPSSFLQGLTGSTPDHLAWAASAFGLSMKIAGSFSCG